MEERCFDTGDHFEESYRVFREKTGQVVRDKEILEIHLPVAVRNILEDNQRRDTFNVLSVGCGNGEIDLHIVEIIQKEIERHEKYKDTKIFNCAFDPNGQSISLYKQDIEESHVGEQTIFDVRQMSWQEYMQERSLHNNLQNGKKFDIVHFIHSMYFVDIQETLVHCFENELNENGQVVCFISDYMTRHISSRLGDTKKYGKVTADECYEEIIKRFAKKRGWNVDHYTKEHFLDFTESFDEESVKGNLLLDFLTQTKNFRATTDKEKVDEILQVMRDKSTEKDGKILSTKIEDLLFIYK